MVGPKDQASLEENRYFPAVLAWMEENDPRGLLAMLEKPGTLLLHLRTLSNRALALESRYSAEFPDEQPDQVEERVMAVLCPAVDRQVTRLQAFRQKKLDQLLATFQNEELPSAEKTYPLPI